MKTIRVTHVLDTLGVGGLEKGVVTLIRNASPEFEHSIICLRRGGEFSRLLPPGTTVVEMRKPPGNSPGFLLQLSRQIRSMPHDVVHTRNWCGMDAIIAARLAGAKKIVHGEHGWDLADVGGMNPKKRLIRQLLSRAVTEYVCVSEQLRDWLTADLGVKRPVTQIYNGIDTGDFSPLGDRTRLHAELGLAKDAVLVGIVARLDPIKNHRTLLTAFQHIAPRHPHCHLVVVGGGPERTHLDCSHPRTHFLGVRKDIPQLMRCFDIFVLPSFNEGISNTILEAMASAVPVIASRAGGNVELVREGVSGFLFPAADPCALAECLELYLNDAELRKRHGQGGGELARTAFTVATMVRQYEDVWRRVAARKG